MLTGLADCICIAFFFLFLLLWPGFILQYVFIGSRDAVEITVYSAAFGIAYLALVCPVLNLFWEISILSVVCTTALLSGLLLVKKLERMEVTFPGKWEIILLAFILSYGVLLRSPALLDPLPQGRDSWIHFSFIQYIYRTHALPEVIPWMEPQVPVSIDLYPPGSHCIGALFSQALQRMSFSMIKGIFIILGAASALSSHVGARKIWGTQAGLLAACVVSIFIPHMIMTSEVTAQAAAIFLYPLIIYLYYQKKWVPASVLLGAMIVLHHFSAFVVLISLGVVALVFIFRKDYRYFFTFMGVCTISLILSAPWLLQTSFGVVGLGFQGFAESAAQKASFNLYTGVVPPLLVILSMFGFFLLLKKRTNDSIFVIGWAIVLFAASQPVHPVGFLVWRFPAFFVFPASIMIALGLLELRKYLKKSLFAALLILIIAGYPSQFWPPTGDENVVANDWISDFTLDSVFYAYGRDFTFVHTLSDRKIYEISDFDNPFDYESEATKYFYDDFSWVPHDIDRFGKFDRIYACSQVVIHRIE